MRPYLLVNTFLSVCGETTVFCPLLAIDRVTRWICGAIHRQESDMPVAHVEIRKGRRSTYRLD